MDKDKCNGNQTQPHGTSSPLFNGQSEKQVEFNPFINGPIEFTSSKYKPKPSTVSRDSINESKEVSKCLQAYCNSLDKVNAALEILLKSRTELKELISIQNILVENRLGSSTDDEISCNGADAVIPGEVKCPVCFEIYSSKIFQCVNGHCICSSCCYNMTSCPECRVPYVGNSNRLVRNRALESLMATSLRVDCPNGAFGCKERLKCKEVQGHMKTCRYKEKSEELLKVESDIGIMKEGIKTLEDKIERLNNKVIETGQKWNVVSSEQQNRLIVIQAKSEHEVLKKEMQKCNLNIRIKSLVYFNQ